jgi:surface antigen
VLANYVSGSGSRSLVCSYTIQAGQNDSTGISVAANKLTLNGGTLQDAVGNAATLTHSAVADNANYVVDNTAPLISSIALTGGTGGVLNVGDVVHITVTMNEPVDVGKVVPTYDPNTGHYLGDLVTEPQLAIKIGDYVVLASYDNTHWWLQTPTTLLFTLGIWIGQNDTNGISIPANALTLHGGYINDLAGNAATLAYSAVDDNANYLVDSTAPTVRSVAISSASGISNGFLNAGDVVSITVTMSDATTVTGTTPYLWLTGLGSANYASGSGTTSLVFNYTIQAGQNVPGGISVYGLLYSEQGYLTGSRGNLVYSNVLPFPALPANAGYRVDTTAPFVLGGGGYLSGATGAVNGVLSAGDVVSFTVVMSEATVVTGTPHYELNIGNSAVQASYASGSGSTDLIFNYTILPGQSDTDGINWSSNKLTLNGGTLTDLAGNVATLRASDYTVSAQADYKVDAIGPVFSSSSTASLSEVARGPAYDATADNDAGVTYTLSGPDAALFYLNDDYSHHGLVTFKAQPNYEQPSDSNGDNVYNLTVTATDAAGNATSQAVAITVTNGADPIDLGWVTLFMPAVTIVNPYGPGTPFIHVANTTPLMGTQDLLPYLIHLGAEGNTAAIPMAALFSLFGLTDLSIEMPPVITEVVHLDLTAPVTMSNGKTYCLVNATVQYWQYDHIDNWVWNPDWFFDTGTNTWVHGKDVKVGPGVDRWDLVYTSTSNALSHEQLDFLMGGTVHWVDFPGVSTVGDTMNTQPSGAVAGVDDSRSVILSGHTLVLPNTSELLALVNDNPWFNPPAGWGDINQYFWSATQGTANTHEAVMLYGPGYVMNDPDQSLHPAVFQVLG